MVGRNLPNKNSAIIYEGLSPYNQTTITSIISGLHNSSDNDKTGDMAQIDIIVADEHPVQAIKKGHDEAICGACPLKGNVCYVNVFHAAASKWRAYKRGSYATLSPVQIGKILRKKNKGVRFGSYGDPAMLPFDVIDTIIRISGVGYTSYTHQWMEPWFDARHLQYSMASVDHINTVEKLRELHPEARYYRIAEDYSNLSVDEIACPSNKEKRDEFDNREVTCENCLLCGGTNKQAKNIAIVEV